MMCEEIGDERTQKDNRSMEVNVSSQAKAIEILSNKTTSFMREGYSVSSLTSKLSQLKIITATIPNNKKYPGDDEKSTKKRDYIAKHSLA